jgi:flagellar biosynthesis protein FlhB
MRLFNKKGQSLQGLFSLALALAGIAIVLVVAFIVISQGRTEISDIEGHNLSSGYNATLELGSALGDIPGWLPIVVIVVVGSVLLGIVKILKT